MPTDLQYQWVSSTLGIPGIGPTLNPGKPAPNTKPEAPTPANKEEDNAVRVPELKTPPTKGGLNLPGKDDALPPSAPKVKSDEPAVVTKAGGLGDSVGRGGKNKLEDVKWVQAALNEKAKTTLEVDGKCGSKTLDAIKKFQAGLGMKKPDGLVEPGKRTANVLSGAGGGSLPEESGDSKEKPVVGSKGNDSKPGLTKEAEAALQEAVKVLDRQPKTKESCEGWMGKVTETFAEVTDKADLAEGKALVAKLEKSFKDHCKLVEQVEAAVDKLKAQPTPAAVSALQKACAHATPGFALLSELTDEALQWWGVNATPEWAKKKPAGKGGGSSPVKPGSLAGGASLPATKAAATGKKDYPELPPDVQEMVDAIDKKRQQGKKSPAEAEKETKDMIRRKMGLDADGWQKKFKGSGPKFSIGADYSDTKSGGDSGSESDGDES